MTGSTAATTGPAGRQSVTIGATPRSGMQETGRGIAITEVAIGAGMIGPGTGVTSPASMLSTIIFLIGCRGTDGIRAGHGMNQSQRQRRPQRRRKRQRRPRRRPAAACCRRPTTPVNSHRRSFRNCPRLRPERRPPTRPRRTTRYPAWAGLSSRRRTRSPAEGKRPRTKMTMPGTRNPACERSGAA